MSTNKPTNNHLIAQTLLRQPQSSILPQMPSRVPPVPMPQQVAQNYGANQLNGLPGLVFYPGTGTIQPFKSHTDARQMAGSNGIALDPTEVLADRVNILSPAQRSSVLRYWGLQ